MSPRSHGVKENFTELRDIIFLCFLGIFFKEFCTDLKVLQGFIGLETIKKQREITQKHRESSKFSPAAGFRSPNYSNTVFNATRGGNRRPKGR